MKILDSLRETSGPTVAVEVAAHQVSAASIEYRSGTALVGTHATEPLPPGALVPSLTTNNIHNQPAVVDAIKRVLERTGRPRRIGLVVPDLVAKVSFVRFEQPPGRAADLEQLIRWQVRKTAPFAVDDAQVSFVPGLKAADGQDFVVSLARRDIVEEYESVCAEADRDRRPGDVQRHQHRARVGNARPRVGSGRRLAAGEHRARLRDDCDSARYPSDLLPESRRG
jgi:Tfp pilus assembly PilM family ATPase